MEREKERKEKKRKTKEKECGILLEIAGSISWGLFGYFWELLIFSVVQYRFRLSVGDFCVTLFIPF